MDNLRILVFLILFISGSVIFIVKKWLIPVRGFIQLSVFTAGEVAFFCKGALCEICPLSFGICPIGTTQRVSFIKKFPSYIVVLIIGAIGIILGSLSCGWICPVGFVQDVLHAPKFREIKVSHKISVLRYLTLLLTIIAVWLEIKYNFFSRRGISIFHHYVIMAGGILLISAVFIKRPFCRIFCPLGLVLGKFNKISLLKVNLNKNACTGCQECNNSCVMDLKPLTQVNSDLCVKCFNCVKVCNQRKQES